MEQTGDLADISTVAVVSETGQTSTVTCRKYTTTKLLPRHIGVYIKNK